MCFFPGPNKTVSQLLPSAVVWGLSCHLEYFLMWGLKSRVQDPLLLYWLSCHLVYKFHEIKSHFPILH